MRKEWRRWGARLMAGIMIATSVWMPVHADVAVAIPAEGKYTTEITEYKKLSVATDTKADRNDEMIDDEMINDEIPDDEILGDEIPDDETPLPTATPTEVIPVEAVLPVATPTAPVMVPVMLASSQEINLSEATTVFTIEQDGKYTFTGKWPDKGDLYWNTNGQVITVKAGVTATLNFRDATIKNGNSDGRYNVLNLEAGAHVTLNLSGTNQFLATTSVSGAAIHVPAGASLTIEGGKEDSLLARSRSYGAGIGGNSGEGAGTIIINGGNIYATSGYREDDSEVPGLSKSGAGIGGGADGASGTIEIHGGAVLAKSSKAAGIGAGGTSPKNNFTVYASSEQARVELRGAGTAQKITVPAGESQLIDENGTLAQIEYGEETSYEVFKVTSEKGANDGITVRSNGSVELSGTGPYTISMINPNTEVRSRVIEIKSACTVTLDGIRMDASFMDKNPPIDIARGLSGVTLILEGKNYLKGAQLTSAIDNHETPLTIQGDGSLTAIAGGGSAAIGASYNGNGNNITIAGGNLTLYGGSDSACIGGGVNALSTPHNFEISGGTVHLIQEHASYLLGSAYRSYGAYDNICISGGEVTGTINYTGDSYYASFARICDGPIQIKAPDRKSVILYAGEKSPGQVVFGTSTEGEHTFQKSDWYMHVTYGQSHSLTVTDGTITNPKTGYAQGEKVPVTAEPKKNGQYFYKWEVTSGSGTFEDPDSENTTFIMGDEDTEITARYKGGSTVTVKNGTKSPEQETYAPGTKVTITASPAETGQYFDSWKITSGTGSTLADAKQSTTTLTVGKEAVEVEAVYKSGYILTVNRGSGSGTYAPGAKITINADTYDYDVRWSEFVGWVLESGSGTFEDASKKDTTFTIGNEDSVIAAQFNRDTGDFVVTGGRYGVDYTYLEESGGLLKIIGSGTYGISLKEGISDSTQQIRVEQGTPTMILHNVRLVSYGTLEIRGTKAKLILDGENSFESTGYTNSYSALNGIAVTQNGSVEITSINGDGSTEGSLYAKGNRQYSNLDHGYAGIGGSAEQIVIKGGTIYAEGSNEGPGIGNNGALENQSISESVHVVVTGGQITAVGKNAPGIGNGARNLGAATVRIADGLKIQEGDSESQLTEVSAADMENGASKAYVEISSSEISEPLIRIISVPKAVYRGEQIQFRAEVTGDSADQVQWYVTGGSSEDTRISADGLLSVGAQEAVGTLTIEAILRGSGKNAIITVPVQDRIVTLSLDQMAIPVGGTVTATATVSGPGAEEIAGRIRFYLDGAPVGSILTLEEGRASYTIPAKLLTGGKHLVNAVYTNSGVTLESNAAEVLVTKKAVTITTWPEYEDSKYMEKPLKELTVKTQGTASVNGTFRFKENNQYPGLGTNSYEISFVPKDSSQYETVSGSVPVTVLKAVPIEYNLSISGSNICYGQTLSVSQFNISRGYMRNGRGQEVKGSWRWKESERIFNYGWMWPEVIYEVADQEHYENYLGKTIRIYVNPTTPTVSLTLSAKEVVAGKTISVSAKAENPYNQALDDVPEPVITYQIGQDGQPQTVTNGTITIPKDTAAGTSIAVMASTATSENYNAANKQANVTVIQKRDISDNLSITVKNTTYGDVILPQGSIRNGSSDGTANWTYQYRIDASREWSDDIPKKVGTYEIKGVYEDESQVGEVTRTFQIVPRTLTVTDAELKEKIYDGTTSAEVLSVTFAGMADGDTVRKIDYTAEAVFADAKAGAGKIAVLQVKLNETPSMANYVLKETQVTLHGKQIQKAEAPVLETQKAIYLTSARGEQKITLTGLPADCGEISGGRAVIQSDEGGILERTVRLDGGQLVIRFNKNSREQAGNQAQIMIYDLAMENYRSAEISLCVELQDDPNQKPDSEPAPDTGGSGNTGSGSGNTGGGSGNTGGGSGNTGGGSGNTGGGSGNTGSGSGNTGGGSGNTGGGSGNTGGGSGNTGGGSGNTGSRGHSHDHDEKRITNSDRTTWIFTGRKWRLRRPNGSYARGSIVSQSFIDGMKVRHQWEQVNGRWYAFDEQGHLKTGFFYDAGYDGWFYVDENAGMHTGWFQIDGKWYYFKDVSDGTRGIMLRNQKTPDGYFVDENGVWKP